MRNVAFSEFFIGTATDGMYVQRWAVAGGGRPIVLVHGGAHTGVFWTMAPGGDGPGWAQHFAGRGYALRRGALRRALAASAEVCSAGHS